jgi:hypothetical protein
VAVGGVRNVASGNYSAVFGGADNEANSAGGTSGGVNNSASGVYSSVVGGLRNKYQY